MKPLFRGIAVAVLQCLIVVSVAGKYALDRQRLPRVWAKAEPYDPSLPVRGRYVSMLLDVEAEASTQYPDYADMPARLSVRDGRLVATQAGTRGYYGSDQVQLLHRTGHPWTLAAPVLFFIPEHAADPSRRPAGEELWVEVSVPPKGPPRPLRLGVKQGGVLTPLAIE